MAKEKKSKTEPKLTLETAHAILNKAVTRPAKGERIPLGSYVRDLSSGFEGIALVRVTKHNGNIRYTVQPMGTGAALPDAYDIDEQLLGIVRQELEPHPLPQTTLELGDRVEDVVCGEKGILTAMFEHFSGCIEFEMISKRTKKHPAGIVRCDHSRFAVLEKGAFPRDQELVDAGHGSFRAKSVR